MIGDVLLWLSLFVLLAVIIDETWDDITGARFPKRPRPAQPEQAQTNCASPYLVWVNDHHEAAQ